MVLILPSSSASINEAQTAKFGIYLVGGCGKIYRNAHGMVLQKDKECMLR
jgi:hypothetical protein